MIGGNGGHDEEQLNFLKAILGSRLIAENFYAICIADTHPGTQDYLRYVQPQCEVKDFEEEESGEAIQEICRRQGIQQTKMKRQPEGDPTIEEEQSKPSRDRGSELPWVGIDLFAGTNTGTNSMNDAFGDEPEGLIVAEMNDQVRKITCHQKGCDFFNERWARDKRNRPVYYTKNVWDLVQHNSILI